VYLPTVTSRRGHPQPHHETARLRDGVRRVTQRPVTGPPHCGTPDSRRRGGSAAHTPVGGGRRSSRCRSPRADTDLYVTVPISHPRDGGRGTGGPLAGSRRRHRPCSPVVRYRSTPPDRQSVEGRRPSAGTPPSDRATTGATDVRQPNPDRRFRRPSDASRLHPNHMVTDTLWRLSGRIDTDGHYPRGQRGDPP